MNLAQRIQDYRYRLTAARRMVRALELREARAWRKVKAIQHWEVVHQYPGESLLRDFVRKACAVGLLFCVTASAQNVALLATNRVPQGDTFTFAWDASSSVVDGYRVYTSTNKTNWRQVAQTPLLTATVSNIFAPCWWVCRSYQGTNESTNSNRIGYLGVDTVVTVTAQSSSNLTSWNTYATIFKGTNPPGMSFFRTYSAAQTYKKFE